MKVNLPPRRLLPRWRRTNATLELREAGGATGPNSSPIQVNKDRFREAMEEWKESPTPGLLGDLLSFSIDPNLRDQVTKVTRDALRSGMLLSEQQKIFASELEAEANENHPEAPVKDDLQKLKQRISETKLLLRTNPANPLALLDLAQHQVSTGRGNRAERTVRAALSLSPDNRIVLRTLARLYVHREKNSEGRIADALKIIGKHHRTPHDPWLMATEITLSEVAGVESKFIKKAERFIQDKRAPIAEVSELAGAIGDIELSFGNLKRAREMFRIALVEPNDNVLAQAISQQRYLGISLNQPSQRSAASSAQEARTLLAWNAIRTEDALRHAWLWHDEEPFSSRPLQFITTFHAVNCEYNAAAEIARQGLIADPNDPTLLVNLSYALASAGRIEEAEAALRQLVRVSPERYTPVVLATRGLIAMKQAQHILGDAYYTEALDIFSKRKEPKLEALCLAYYARSAYDSEHPNKEAILLRAKELYVRNPSADTALVLRKLEPEISLPQEDESSRQLMQWVFDPKTNSITRKPGVTKPGEQIFAVKRD